MTEKRSSIIGVLKFVGYVIAVLVGLAIAINHYVRVAGPGDKSTGVVVTDNIKRDWESRINSLGGRYAR